MGQPAAVLPAPPARGVLPLSLLLLLPLLLLLLPLPVLPAHR